LWSAQPAIHDAAGQRRTTPPQENRHRMTNDPQLDRVLGYVKKAIGW
jgi:hypothetical protein